MIYLKSLFLFLIESDFFSFQGYKSQARKKNSRERDFLIFFVSILSFYRTDLTINAEILVHVHCDSTCICICFNKISFFPVLFSKLRGWTGGAGIRG